MVNILSYRHAHRQDHACTRGLDRTISHGFCLNVIRSIDLFHFFDTCTENYNSAGRMSLKHLVIGIMSRTFMLKARFP